jgi:hypothetical protein
LNDSNSAPAPIVLGAVGATALARWMPLWIAGIGLVLLPFAMRALGLTLDTATWS